MRRLALGPNPQALHLASSSSSSLSRSLLPTRQLQQHQHQACLTDAAAAVTPAAGARQRTWLLLLTTRGRPGMV
jgi:hypothetical protein